MISPDDIITFLAPVNTSARDDYTCRYWHLLLLFVLLIIYLFLLGDNIDVTISLDDNIIVKFAVIIWLDDNMVVIFWPHVLYFITDVIICLDDDIEGIFYLWENWNFNWQDDNIGKQYGYHLAERLNRRNQLAKKCHALARSIELQLQMVHTYLGAK